jgi:hypothetical protein
LKGLKFLKKFQRNRRGLELDYMLSLFIFIISLGYTFLILTQYLDVKADEVGEINERLAALRVIDDMTGSPGWMGTRTDWETLAPSVDLEEKINDQTFFLGLRKNDQYHGIGIIIPKATDSEMQTAAQGTIANSLSTLTDAGVIVVDIGSPFRALVRVNTSATNAVVFAGSEDNVTTHVGTLYVGGSQDLMLTDMTPNEMIHYDTVYVGVDSAQENSILNLSGRSFTVHTIDQEKVLLLTQFSEGYLLPNLDDYHHGMADQELTTAGIEFVDYTQIVSGGSSSLDYTLFGNEAPKFEGQATGLSAKKIAALNDHVLYEIAKAALGLELDFHITITRDSDEYVLLDYGLLTPGDTEMSERQVDVEGVPCTFTVHVW